MVVTVTLRGPGMAFAAIEIEATIVVALTTVTLFVVMPEPKPTIEVALNPVFNPAIVTSNTCPCTPEFGVALRICGGAAPTTVNALA